jgi:hypothetical protein
MRMWSKETLILMMGEYKTNVIRRFNIDFWMIGRIICDVYDSTDMVIWDSLDTFV